MNKVIAARRISTLFLKLMSLFVLMVLVSQPVRAYQLVNLVDRNGNFVGLGILCRDGTVVRCLPGTEGNACPNDVYACHSHGEPGIGRPDSSLALPRGPGGTDAYVSANVFGGYDQLGEDFMAFNHLSLTRNGGVLPPLGELVPGERLTALQGGAVSTDTTFQGGAGALLHVTPHLTLDVGLALSSGQVRQDFSLFGVPPGEPAENSRPISGFAETDVEILSGQLAARVYPLRSRRLNPWLSMGVVGRVVHGEETTWHLGDRSVRVDELDTLGDVSLVSGAGLDLRLTDRASLSLSGSYAFESGWNAGLGLTVPLERRSSLRRPEVMVTDLENPEPLPDDAPPAWLFQLADRGEEMPAAQRAASIGALTTDLTGFLDQCDVLCYWWGPGCPCWEENWTEGPQPIIPFLGGLAAGILFDVVQCGIRIEVDAYQKGQQDPLDGPDGFNRLVNCAFGSIGTR